MFPKMGKSFPDDSDRQADEADYALTIAAALRQELGNSHQGIKTVMRWSGAEERTVKNWFAGTCGPNGRNLIALVRHSEIVLNAFLLLSDRQGSMTVPKIAAIREKLFETVCFIDLVANRTS